VQSNALRCGGEKPRKQDRTAATTRGTSSGPSPRVRDALRASCIDLGGLAETVQYRSKHGFRRRFSVHPGAREHRIDVTGDRRFR
jgi:hypothetical protein